MVVVVVVVVVVAADSISIVKLLPVTLLSKATGFWNIKVIDILEHTLFLHLTEIRQLIILQ